MTDLEPIRKFRLEPVIRSDPSKAENGLTTPDGCYGNHITVRGDILVAKFDTPGDPGAHIVDLLAVIRNDLFTRGATWHMRDVRQACNHLHYAIQLLEHHSAVIDKYDHNDDLGYEPRYMKLGGRMESIFPVAEMVGCRAGWPWVGNAELRGVAWESKKDQSTMTDPDL